MTDTGTARAATANQEPGLDERLAPRIAEAKAELVRLNGRVTGFIRENPALSLLCAVGVGFVIGKLASRK